VLKFLFPEKNRINLLVGVFYIYYITLLTVGTISSEESNTFNTIIVWGGSPLLMILFFYYFFLKPVSLPIESILIIAFFIFVLLGYTYVLSDELYLKGLRKLFLYLFLFIIVQYMVMQTGNLNAIFIPLTLGSLYICYTSVFNNPDNSSISAESNFKLESGFINQNGLANYSVNGIFGVLYFYRNLPERIRNFIWLILPAFLMSLIGAASKTGFINMIITFLLWSIFCLRKSIKNPEVYILVMAVFLVGLNYLADFIIENTYLGQRLNELSDVDQFIEQDSRSKLIFIAIDIFLDNIVLGVGLDQFRLYNATGAYSHNEYLEVLSSFGIIGSLIYFPYYFKIYQRIGSALKNLMGRNDIVEYNLNLMKVLFLVILIRGISVPILFSIDELFLLAAAGGYAHYIKSQLTISS
jgi:hypothetical protein